ncbi:TetR/AcrR family transcriptional regulator [Microbacterium sp. 22195]|uniref:TetR/AcrR family transcriptional regulator n=1 Tax=Microbacterium sp. 22195 TaxID=3453891 RepID=UPI003F839459
MSFPSQYASEVRKRRPRQAAEQTREQAIRAAVAQIAEVGFHKMTLADVAKRTGISQSGLLHHFPSRAALLAAVLEQREQDDREFLFGDGQVPLGWDAFEALVSLAARNTTRPDWVAVFVRVAAEATEEDHPGHDWLVAHYDGARRWLTDAVESGIASGEFSPEAPTALIVGNTIAVQDGIQQQWLLAPNTVPLVQHLRQHVDDLRAAWGTHPSHEVQIR